MTFFAQKYFFSKPYVQRNIVFGAMHSKSTMIPHVIDSPDLQSNGKYELIHHYLSLICH